MESVDYDVIREFFEKTGIDNEQIEKIITQLKNANSNYGRKMNTLMENRLTIRNQKDQGMLSSRRR